MVAMATVAYILLYVDTGNVVEQVVTRMLLCSEFLASIYYLPTDLITTVAVLTYIVSYFHTRH